MTAHVDQKFVELIEEARRSEKEQALRYRSLAAQAEESEPDQAERFHNLHADEQHHLSRLTARMLELGAAPQDHRNRLEQVPVLAEWEENFEVWEQTEIELYTRLLREIDDQETIDLLRGILEVEQQHLQERGGKWTVA